MNEPYKGNRKQNNSNFPPPDPSERVTFSSFDPRRQSSADSYKDFEELCHSIESAVKNISKAAAQGIGQAGSAVGDAVSQAINNAQASQASKRTTARPTKNASSQRDLATRKQKALLNTRFKSPAGNNVAGVTLAIVGGCGIMTFGSAGIIGAVIEGMTTRGVLGIGACALIAGLSIWAMVAGIKRLSLSQHLRSIKRIMGTREVVTFKELSAQMHLSKKKLLSITRKLLKRGLLPEGHIDDECTCLMVTNDAYRQYRQAKIAYQRRIAEEQSRRQAKVKGIAAITSESDRRFITEGHAYLERFRQLDIAIDDEAVSKKICDIEDVVERILQRAQDDPSVIDDLSRLSDYYLPTTIKLLEAYEALEDETIQGENILRSRAEIDYTLSTLATAFEKLLDSTYEDLSIDVSSDITVLNSFLAQDGLTEDPFKKDKNRKGNYNG